MKPKLLIILPVMALALGGGFLLLQSPQDTEDATITSPDSTTTTSSSASVTEERSTDGAVSVNSEPSPSVDSEKKAKKKAARKEKSKQQQEMISKMVLDKLVADAEQKRSALEALLNLSPEQAAALQVYYDENNEILKNLHQYRKETDEAKKKLVDAITEAGLADYMEEHLTEDQQAALESYQQEQSDNHTDKLALKELSAVIGVTGMSDEQGQAAYDILNADVVTELDSQSDQQIIASHMASMFGMEEETLSGMMQHMGEIKKLNEAGKSLDEIVEVINAKQEVALGQKVQRLSEVLDATQLESYRDHLQEKVDAMSDLIKMSVKISQ